MGVDFLPGSEGASVVRDWCDTILLRSSHTVNVQKLIIKVLTYHTVDELDHLKSSQLNSKNISFCSHECLESLECWISKCLSTLFFLTFTLLNSFRDNNSIYKYFHHFLVLKTIIVVDIFDYGSVGLVPLIGIHGGIYVSSVTIYCDKITGTWIQIHWCSNAHCLPFLLHYTSFSI